MERIREEKRYDVGARRELRACSLSFPCYYLDHALMYASLPSNRGAKEVLMDYYKKIGGRPELRATSSVAKRGRQSTGSVPASATPKNNKRARTSLGAKNAEDVSPAPSDDKWKPPAKGSWEDEITAIDTIEKTNNGLVCYVQWYVYIYDLLDVKLLPPGAAISLWLG